MIVDKLGIPLNLLTESANVSEYRLALPTIDGVSVASRPLHPKKRARELIADKGYDAKWLRKAIRARSTKPHIPKRKKKGSTQEPSYNQRIREKYKTRWVVERTNAWLQNYRRVTVRWDRHPENYEGFLELACILICLRRV